MPDDDVTRRNLILLAVPQVEDTLRRLVEFFNNEQERFLAAGDWLLKLDGPRPLDPDAIEWQPAPYPVRPIEAVLREIREAADD